MSVTYVLNIPIKIRELRENGFKVINMEDVKESAYSFMVEDSEYDSAVGVLRFYQDEENPLSEDDIIITRFEGRCSYGGGICMLRICDKLNRKFVTDEDIDNLFREAEMEGKEDIMITDEMFEHRVNNFREYLTKEHPN